VVRHHSTVIVVIGGSGGGVGCSAAHVSGPRALNPRRNR
jgi:hypothetical protein